MTAAALVMMPPSARAMTGAAGPDVRRNSRSSATTVSSQPGIRRASAAMIAAYFMVFSDLLDFVIGLRIHGSSAVGAEFYKVHFFS